jgi:hypothetical protein
MTPTMVQLPHAIARLLWHALQARTTWSETRPQECANLQLLACLLEPDLARNGDVTAHVNVVRDIIKAAYGIAPSR